MQIEEIYRIYKNHPIISIDNRKIEPGCIFIGIRGEKFDGNRFAASALEAGASYAIIDNQEFYIDHRTILVQNTLYTLQQLANHHRRTFNIPFIAICGSNGKTTTKELTYAVLNSTFKTFATKGNLNNHIGVPLTLLSVPFNTEIGIIEIGANHLGETAELCRIAEPDFGVVTNNGKDHLEGFESIENVIKANAELFVWLREIQGHVFLNVDKMDLVVNATEIQVWTYGTQKDSDFSYEVLAGEKLATIKMNESGKMIKSNLFGDFNGDNLATAAAIGKYFKVSDENIATAIGNYQPGMNRSQILKKNDITFYVDCYNANPSSMKLALESFKASAFSPTMVVLGDMLELGPFSEHEHAEIVEQVKAAQFEKVVLIGKYFGQLKNNLSCHHFEKTEEAIQWFSNQKLTGYSILLKGSRGYALERLISF